MNNLIPTFDYRVWYDPIIQGTRIKTKEAEYFIPDNRMIDIDKLISSHISELAQFKCNSPV